MEEALTSPNKSFGYVHAQHLLSPDLSTRDKLVLLAIGSYASIHGTRTICPSINTLKDLTQQSRYGVCMSIKTLRDRHIISVSHDLHGSDRYRAR